MYIGYQKIWRQFLPGMISTAFNIVQLISWFMILDTSFCYHDTFNIYFLLCF